MNKLKLSMVCMSVMLFGVGPISAMRILTPPTRPATAGPRITRNVQLTAGALQIGMLAAMQGAMGAFSAEFNAMMIFDRFMIMSTANPGVEQITGVAEDVDFAIAELIRIGIVISGDGDAAMSETAQLSN